MRTVMRSEKMKIIIDSMKIAAIMAQKGFTQAEIAKRGGLSPYGVARILKNKSCTCIAAGKLATALGVDIRDIMKGEE